MKIVHRGLLRMARLDTDRSRYRSTGYLLLLLYANKEHKQEPDFFTVSRIETRSRYNIALCISGREFRENFPSP